MVKIFDNIKQWFVREAKTFYERVTYKSPLYAKSQFNPYNPDDLVRKKGLSIFETMMKDDQVKGVMIMKQTCILGNGYDIVPASDDKADKDRAEFVEYVLGDGMSVLAGNRSLSGFFKTMRNMLTALTFGFSVTEKVLGVYAAGKYKGKVGFKALKVRPPHGFEFYTDDYNNLAEIKYSSNKHQLSFKDNDIDYFIIYSYDADNTTFGGWYGLSDLRAAYRAWWSKDIIVRFMNIFIERFGMGIVVGKYPSGMSDDDKSALQEMIDNISAKTAFSIPEKVVIEILEAKATGQAPHISAIDHYNKAIARSLLLPDKLGYTDTEGGTYNLGEKQFDLFYQYIAGIRQEIEEIINEQVIRYIVDMNFANVDSYPYFKFRPFTEKDKAAMADMFFKAANAGVIEPMPEDEDYMREELGFPKRTEPRNQETDDKDDKEEDDKAKEKQMKLFTRAPSKYEAKIDFKATKRDLDDHELEFANDMSKVIGRIRDEVTSTVQRKDIVGSKDYNLIDSMDLRYLGEMRMLFRDLYERSFMLGMRHGKRDIAKKRMMAKVPDFGALPPLEALEMLKKKAIYITGVERDFIKNKVKALLYDAIKTGKTTNQVVYDIDEFFAETYGSVQQRTGAGEIKDITEIPGRIETIVRTNVNDAYNQGRRKAFDENEFVVAYEYSAIMDSRVSDVCSELDGKVYKVSNPIWDKVTPPNHFNCRSTLIPILADEWDGQESSLPDLNMLEAGFGK